jgi:hypothetical protein
MAQEVKYNTSHHAGATAAERIASRLRNSGERNADVVVQKGEGPTRTYHNIFHSGSAKRHGEGRGGEDIQGNKRGVV